MIPQIHKKVLGRLFLGWLLLSAAIGAVVLYLETEKIDEFVLGLALRESGVFTSADFIRIDRADRLAQLQRKSEALIERHFVVVEIYGTDKRLILESIGAGKEAVEARINAHAHGFPLKDAMQYKKFLIGGRLFLQVVAPMKGEAGEPLGYFEGVYQVDDATLSNIVRDLIRSLVLVVVVVFVTTALLYPIIIALNRDLIRYARGLLRGNIELMEVLGSAVAKRDSDTNLHNYRVTIYAIRLAEELGLSSERIRHLIAGAFLHDVGKIGISDNILLKPARLTSEEFTAMRAHVPLGLDIVEKSDWLRSAKDVIEFHHERYDGGGYPRGLKAREIPLNARVFAIVDVFDALTSKRPYKEPFSLDEAMRVMRRENGSHFDPDLLETFGRIAPGLYEEIGHSDEPAVYGVLQRLIGKHFFQQKSAQ